jgi:hypothetical protein
LALLALHARSSGKTRCDALLTAARGGTARAADAGAARAAGGDVASTADILSSAAGTSDASAAAAASDLSATKLPVANGRATCRRHG